MDLGLGHLEVAGVVGPGLVDTLARHDDVELAPAGVPGGEDAPPLHGDADVAVLLDLGPR